MGKRAASERRAARLAEREAKKQAKIEADALEIALNGVERGFLGVIKALCLALDGTVAVRKLVLVQ